MDIELTLDEKREALEMAYDRLSVDEQAQIDAMIIDLMTYVKRRNRHMQFGRIGGLELLAQVGQFLNQGIGGRK